MAQIGDVFSTGEINPTSGVYRHYSHVSNCPNITQGQFEIPLSRGETFPPYPQCNHAVGWQLVRLA